MVNKRRKNKEPDITVPKEKISKPNEKRLDRSFFNTECKQLAVDLLGKVLVRKIENEILKARIVETESYLADIDKACCTYNGRRTERNEAMFMAAGTAYVYMTYGMYHCINISSQEPGAAVLLRALEPLDNIELMTQHRLKKRKSPGGKFKVVDLCNGPSKLCMSMDINKNNGNQLDLADESNQLLWVEDDGFDSNFQVVNTHRIGIESVGGEWAKMPLRYYIYGNPAVSKVDKEAEKKFSA